MRDPMAGHWCVNGSILAVALPRVVLEDDAERMETIRALNYCAALQNDPENTLLVDEADED